MFLDSLKYLIINYYDMNSNSLPLVPVHHEQCKKTITFPAKCFLKKHTQEYTAVTTILAEYSTVQR